jgi:hypothetical protein
LLLLSLCILRLLRVLGALLALRFGLLRLHTLSVLRLLCLNLLLLLRSLRLHRYIVRLVVELSL